MSTINPLWREAMAVSPRFRGVAWDMRCEVEVLTLDGLIARHGVPTFCKLDVEGAEAQVLAGLSRPLPALSFEYSPAALEGALACIERLGALGAYRFRRSVAESLRWSGTWMTARQMRADLDMLSPVAPAGDLYAERIA